MMDNYFVVYQDSMNPKQLAYVAFNYQYEAQAFMDRIAFWYVCLVDTITDTVYWRR